MLRKLLIPLTLLFSVSSLGQVVLTKDNTIDFNDVFSGESVAPTIKKARELDARVESADPIYLVLHSPGGEIESGLELIANFSTLRRPVKTISLFSASMAFQTVQGIPGERLITTNGTLMSHRAMGGLYGNIPGSLGVRLNYYIKRFERMDSVTVSRSGGKLTPESYARLIADEYWCDGQDCVDQGVADKVVTVSCDKSLEGTKSIPLLQDIFMGHTIEVDAEYELCPLNTNALKYTIVIDGQPLFAPAAASTNKNVTIKDDPYGLYAYRETPDSPLSKLSKDEVFMINQKVQDAITKSENGSRQVVKGY